MMNSYGWQFIDQYELNLLFTRVIH
jgi:hypothetical protein